jgi:iron complex transport system permease protein
MKDSLRFSIRKPFDNGSLVSGKGPIRSRVLAIYFVLTVALAVLFFAALFRGTVRVPAGDILVWLFGGDIGAEEESILFLLRLPRAIACVLCGMGLALSGLTLQTSMNNAIVGPGIIGINSGAGFFLVIASVMFPFNVAVRSLAVLIGAMASAGITVGIVRARIDASRLTIVLAGVAVSSFFTAGTDMVITIFPGVIYDRMSFLIGSFAMVGAEQILWALPFILVGTVGILSLSSRLNLLTLGDDIAVSLGVRVALVRLVSIIFAASAVAGAVEICGLIGFVGLVVPHMARRMLKDQGGFRTLCHISMLSGAVLVLFCDILARTMFPPYELPVGLLLSLIGAPYFLYLLLKGKRRVTE